jgi:hypothetical protein
MGIYEVIDLPTERWFPTLNDKGGPTKEQDKPQTAKVDG